MMLFKIINAKNPYVSSVMSNPFNVSYIIQHNEVLCYMLIV